MLVQNLAVMKPISGRSCYETVKIVTLKQYCFDVDVSIRTQVAVKCVIKSGKTFNNYFVATNSGKRQRLDTRHGRK